jgi:UDP-2,4-diacetamido-2,4,6-trideoxy-beta-L-altropyranose hydrolase
MPCTLLIRADASVSIGTGHVMRMIALAQAWQGGGGEAVFLCAEITPALEVRLKEEGFLLEKIQASSGSHEDLEATCAAIARYGVDSIPVALDGYQFDAAFQLGLKKAGCRLLVMDDYGHAAFFHADWVLNQNLSAREELYASRAPHTQLFLGTKFALLRREFLKYRGWQRQIPEIARTVLVTLGGADPDNVTGKVIEALAPFDIQVKVVVGGSNPHLPDLQRAFEGLKTQPAKIELIVNPTDMPGLMAWADLAIAAGGSTAWELAFMGLPSIFVILAENQVGIATELESAGFGVCLGRGADFDKGELQIALRRVLENPAERHRTSIAGRNLVDGMGCHRTVCQLNQTSPICLRPVSYSDIELLWEWANDPVTRQNSFDSAKIPWEEHSAWCQKKLSEAGCRLWIASNGGNAPVGCVRFDGKESEATISLTVAPNARGKGYGTKIIQQSCDRLFAESPFRLVHAYIKPENIASVKVFEAAGFRYDSDAVCKQKTGRHYTLRAKS